jgi:hypothetical protein
MRLSHIAAYTYEEIKQNLMQYLHFSTNTGWFFSRIAACRHKHYPQPHATKPHSRNRRVWFERHQKNFPLQCSCVIFYIKQRSCKLRKAPEKNFKVYLSARSAGKFGVIFTGAKRRRKF